MKCDFSGYATRNNMKCSDGRTIMKDAFVDNDGSTVPLVWNHDHSSVESVLGHAILENREDGVYAYGFFNETESGQAAKQLVKNGDVKALSIYANKLQHDKRKNVMHGAIKEVSLVLAGANPGAYIDNVLVHGDGSEELMDDAVIYFNIPDNNIELYHSDEEGGTPTVDNEETKSEETVGDIYNAMNEKQKAVVDFLVANALEESGADQDEEGEDMKHNAFEEYDGAENEDSYLSHAEEMEILKIAKNNKVSSFKSLLSEYVDDDSLAHGIDQTVIGELFPEPELITKGAPELIRDYPTDWVATIMNGVTKSPYARVRTRHADARKRELEAKGYKKGSKKTPRGDIKLLNRTTDPQTVYMVEQVHRDDILDIEDFDYVNFVRANMMDDLKEDLATAIMVGDGREDSDPYKIHEDKIRPIWTDNELYTIHRDVDIAATRAKLNGTDTSKHFGDNYIYAEAIVEASIYAQEDYRSKKGTPTLFAAPHLINQMMLARDLNGRRIYNTRAELASALNVSHIVEVKKFEGMIRKDAQNKKHSLLGFILNLSDYQIGNAKGGQITSFDDFDIDFNTYKYLIETRLSGALINPYCAIVLEEPVSSDEDDGE